MYTRAMQRIRRTAHQRRVHETQRLAQVAAEREQCRRGHAHARAMTPRDGEAHRPRDRVGGGAVRGAHRTRATHGTPHRAGLLAGRGGDDRARRRGAAGSDRRPARGLFRGPTALSWGPEVSTKTPEECPTMDRSRPTRRDFLRIGGAGAGLMLIGQVGGQAFRMPAALAVPGGLLDAITVPKFQSALLIPPVMPRVGSHPATRWTPDRRVRHLGPAARPAGAPGRHADDDRVGIRARGHGSAERPARPQRAVVHDRGAASPCRSASRGSTTSWTRRATTCRTCCRSTRRCTGRTPRGGEDGRTAARTFGPRPGPTPARSRSSPTSTGRASATRATATRRPGTCRTRTTSPTAARRRAAGTRSSRDKARRGSGVTWEPGSATFHYPNDQPRHDALVPRPHAGA